MVLSVGVCLLAGCSSTPSVRLAAAPETRVGATSQGSTRLTEAQADIVMAHAIAQHEMRRP